MAALPPSLLRALRTAHGPATAQRLALAVSSGKQGGFPAHGEAPPVHTGRSALARARCTRTAHIGHSTAQPPECIPQQPVSHLRAQRRRPLSVAAAAGDTSAASDSQPWTISLVPCLRDNYAYLIHSQRVDWAAVVDPSEAGPVAEAVERLGLRLSHVLCTHHHWDHTGGNLDLKRRYGAKVVGPAADAERIPGIDIALSDNQAWKLHDLDVTVLHVPGHTSGHCAFHFPQLGAVFTGDTLFSLGCGRLFEGSPQQMWSSLQRLSQLPQDTQVYCGHEYTQSNARFALTVEPGNAALQDRVAQVTQLREDSKPTVPVLLAVEMATNPFLRPNSQEIRSLLGLPSSTQDVDVFAALRKAKDSF